MMIMKPKLLVTALSATPYSGSEPGKAFNWTLALSRYFQVHVMLLADKVSACKDSGLCSDWIFHPLEIEGPTRGGIPFYFWYLKWCKSVEYKCKELVLKEMYVGLHHPVLGSFRMFPRYDLLGIRYTLGPIGGAETSPRGLLKECGLPRSQRILEACRPLINNAAVHSPSVYNVIRGAAKVLATTRETELLMIKAGALKTASVFPDVVEASKINDAEIISARRGQLASLGNKFRLVFSGRAIWWKGGQLAIHFLDCLLKAGIPVFLDIYGDGPALKSWKRLALQLRISTEDYFFHGMVSRQELLKAYSKSHLFVYPTLHDSSSSAIPEAYMTALPSMTLWCGGARMAASREAGINFTPSTIGDFYSRGVEVVREWIANPDLWFKACTSSLAFSKKFSLTAIEKAVEENIVPEFVSII